MCGMSEICGWLRNDDPARLEASCNHLRHRGPGAPGLWMVPESWANVDDVVEQFEYQPNTSVERGVANFAAWFKEY